MIPFQLHRRLPLIRLPFDHLDLARAECERLTTRLAIIEIERDDLRAECDRLEDELRLRTAVAANDAVPVLHQEPAPAASDGETGPEPGPNRMRDLKRTYVEHVERTKSTVPRAQALEFAVGGGEFDLVGRIEVSVLRTCGLQPDDFLIDVGCGSGRLAKPLAAYLRGNYSGFDIVDDLVEYAREITQRPDWRFEAIDHIGIPEPDGCADMVCFFSVLTHLLHEQSYWYLEEALRVLKPTGRIVFSFIEFSEPGHWLIFMSTLEHTKTLAYDPINVFISRDMIGVWAAHLGLEIEMMLDAGHSTGLDGALGQAVCVLRRPQPAAA